MAKPGKGNKDKIETLEARLRAQRARLMRLKGKQRSEDERRKTRQKIIVGAALLTDAAILQDRKEALLTVLQRAVIVERDRQAIANILAGDLSAFDKSNGDGQK
jgi:hypothetical protein